jgi:uncharacterized protein (TIGR00369 family)
MDTTTAIQRVPRREDSDDDWRTWANSYSTLRAARMTCTRIDDHSADFVLEDSFFPLNPNGAVNGGVVSLVADQAMGVLAIRTAAEGSLPATAVLQVHFHRPALAPLTLRANLIPGGRNIKTVEILVSDRDGQRCVTATGTMASGRNPLDRVTDDAC